MRYHELFEVDLTEGVVLNGAEELIAYAIAVAEAYDSAPVYDPGAAKSWAVLNQHNVNVLFKRLIPTIKVEWSHDDPYDLDGGDMGMAIRRMLYDMVVNRRLKIFTGFSDDHPVFSPQENVIFRTVHDYYTHAKLIKAFKDGLSKINKPSDDDLVRLLPKIDLTKKGNIGQQFSLRGEMNAYVTHSKLAPPSARPALFTEIIGQVCYNTVVGDFPKQKVAALNGFDLVSVGKTHGEARVRYDEVLEMIMGGENSLRTKISSVPEIVVSELLTKVKRS